MLIEKRIKRAERKTIGLFDKKNDLKKEAEISLDWVNLGVDEFNMFLDKEIKQLDKVNRRYEKAFSKLDRLKEKNGSKRMSIMRAAEA